MPFANQLFLLCLLLSCYLCKELLILDHDGGVDDISALILLLGATTHKFELKAVTIQPADCFADSALQATTKYLNYLGAHHVRIAMSNMEGTHPFPNHWREDSNKTEQKIDQLVPTIRDWSSTNVVETMTAPELLVELLSQGEEYTIVCTGPLSNLATALQMNPLIAKYIKQLYIMGGAVFVPGNVEEYPLAGEWNFYNNASAAHYVIHHSHIVNITLVGLDATNFVPVHQPLQEHGLPPLQLFLKTQSKALQLQY